MVLAASRGISRVPRYSGTCPASQQVFVYRAVTVSGRSFQIVRLACWFVTRRRPLKEGARQALQPQRACTLVWAPPRSLAATSGITDLFSLPPGTEMVHFPGLSPSAYGFSGWSAGMTQRGLPHSEISGSKPVCGSPKLIAAYRVLRRLLAPRHSPYALSSLTIKPHL